ncbi:MAG: PorV/PorQ family protein [Bacteroidia bacterium]|nr:PorV/PorQ family protein [Bacteroidia bacterium]
MKKFILGIFISAGICPGFAQSLKYSNEFLAIGIGGRAIGMGGAVIASTRDVTSTYWNPAGLMGMDDNIQIGAMHNEQFGGITKHDYGVIGFKLNDHSKMAISMIRLGVDGIPNTLYLMQDGQINYALIRSFSAVDYAFVGTYATQTKLDGLTVGGNVKVIRRVIGSFGGAWGFGLDAAVNYKKGDWSLAFVAKDITSTFNAWNYKLSNEDKAQFIATGNAIPSGGLEITLPKFTIGVARKFEFGNGKYTILPEINMDFTTDGQRNVLVSSKYVNLDPRFGLELGYNKIIFLRGGYSTLQRITDFSGQKTINGMPGLGIGIQLKNFAIDYALGNAFNQGLLGMSNVISLRLSINKKS